MRTWRGLAESGALGRARVYEDREVIFGAGDVARGAFYLFDGAVEIYQETSDGRVMVVRLLVAPCIFGLLEPLGGESHYLESMRAVDHALVNEVAAGDFFAIVKTNHAAAVECLATTAMAFCAVARTEAARLAEVDGVLAGSLLAYARLFGDDVPEGRRLRLRRSQKDLGDIIGASERQVHRILLEWKRRGLVDKLDARYVIRDVEALRGIAAGYDEGLVHRGTPMPRWVG